MKLLLCLFLSFASTHSFAATYDVQFAELENEFVSMTAMGSDQRIVVDLSTATGMALTQAARKQLTSKIFDQLAAKCGGGFIDVTNMDVGVRPYNAANGPGANLYGRGTAVCLLQKQ